jgi:D-amino peptidase
MRCYLSVDMEGLAGIAHPAQCSFDSGADRTDYDRGRMLMAGEVEALLPWAERVVVKHAVSPFAADSLSPEDARSAIAAGVQRALKRPETMQAYRLDGPLRLEIDLAKAAMADYCAIMPGVERTGPRTVLARAADAEELYRYMIAIVRMASIPG